MNCIDWPAAIYVMSEPVTLYKPRRLFMTYLKLADQKNTSWQNRVQFFAAKPHGL
jgi:hypothetical protein